MAPRWNPFRLRRRSLRNRKEAETGSKSNKPQKIRPGVFPGWKFPVMTRGKWRKLWTALDEVNTRNWAEVMDCIETWAAGNDINITIKPRSFRDREPTENASGTNITHLYEVLKAKEVPDGIIGTVTSDLHRLREA